MQESEESFWDPDDNGSHLNLSMSTHFLSSLSLQKAARRANIITCIFMHQEINCLILSEPAPGATPENDCLEKGSWGAVIYR